ncbi:hypothetical protein SBADM41S_05781 [Streptomyces badius]
MRAPEAWAAGFDGKGTKVAVLDTGIDADHPDVKDRLVGARSFVPGEEVDDKHGHGTHVASTIAGSGAGSDGANKGVAPAAALLVGKVLSDEGSGADSGIIEAMEWAKAEGADIVSMSLGSPVPDDGTDPMSQAVNSLSADGGPLFVIAAGNAYGAGTIGSPGSAEQALTVAAVDKRDGRGFADYLYDLVDRHDGTIPDRSLAFAPSTRRLAKVENTFYGHKRRSAPATATTSRTTVPASASRSTSSSRTSAPSGSTRCRVTPSGTRTTRSSTRRSPTGPTRCAARSWTTGRARATAPSGSPR